MRIVIAPDSFKESLSAPEAAEAMARGVRRVVPDADVTLVPMADGGEGFVDALAASLDAAVQHVPLRDPLGRPSVGLLAVAGRLAVIEVAQAVGLSMVSPPERDVMRASSTGVGDLVTAALDASASRLVVGLGGSATNDGGAGMLDALGVRFLDGQGRRLTPTPEGLAGLATIDASGLDPRLARADISAACDVDNPLLGPEGASAIFGPQKGATPQQVAALDGLLARLADAAASATGRDTRTLPGAGAAGGLGWALLQFLGARMTPGVDLVADTVGLSAKVRGADLVLTGEGSVDAQTLAGKTPAGVAAVAKEAGVPVVVLAGRVAPDADVLLDAGVVALVPVIAELTPLTEALAQGAVNVERATATVLRLWTHGGFRGRQPRSG